MSRFFVGQRVRKTRRTGLRNENVPVGSVGVIVAIGPFMAGHVHADGVSAIDCDCQVTYSGATRTSDALFDCLEPILPDGHRACDEEFKRDLDRLLEGVQA